MKREEVVKFVRILKKIKMDTAIDYFIEILECAEKGYYKHCDKPNKWVRVGDEWKKI